MVDWNAALQRKYDILQQNADTSRLGAVAEANLRNVQAGLMPGEVRSNTAYRDAQTTGLGITNRYLPQTIMGTLAEQQARTSGLNIANQFAPALARSLIGTRDANSAKDLSQASALDVATSLNKRNEAPLSDAESDQLGKWYGVMSRPSPFKEFGSLFDSRPLSSRGLY